MYSCSSVHNYVDFAAPPTWKEDPVPEMKIRPPPFPLMTGCRCFGLPARALCLRGVFQRRFRVLCVGGTGFPPPLPPTPPGVLEVQFSTTLTTVPTGARVGRYMNPPPCDRAAQFLSLKYPTPWICPQFQRTLPSRLVRVKVICDHPFSV